MIRFILISAMGNNIIWNGKDAGWKVDAVVAWQLPSFPQARNAKVRLPQLPKGHIVIVNHAEWTPTDVTVFGEVWPE